MCFKDSSDSELNCDEESEEMKPSTDQVKMVTNFFAKMKALKVIINGGVMILGQVAMLLKMKI